MSQELKNELREKTTGYIIAALGLVAGLAWNDAIKGLIERLMPASGNGSVIAKFVYAIMITVLIVSVSYSILRVTKQDARHKD